MGGHLPGISQAYRIHGFSNLPLASNKSMKYPFMWTFLQLPKSCRFQKGVIFVFIVINMINPISSFNTNRIYHSAKYGDQHLT